MVGVSRPTGARPGKVGWPEGVATIAKVRSSDRLNLLTNNVEPNNQKGFQTHSKHTVEA